MSELALPSPAEAPAQAVQVLGMLSEVQRRLAGVTDPGEASHLIRQADAIRYLARKAETSQDLKYLAAETSLRARRKIGQLLEELRREPGTRTDLAEDMTPYQQGVEAAGFDIRSCQQLQQLGRMPEEWFCDWLEQRRAEGRELSTTAAFRAAKILARLLRQLARDGAEPVWPGGNPLLEMPAGELPDYSLPCLPGQRHDFAWTCTRCGAVHRAGAGKLVREQPDGTLSTVSPESSS